MPSGSQDDHFEKWTRYLRETRAAAEPWEKAATEYQKFAVEYSKLLVTNLYVLNAGGMISLPALSSFLGVSTLPRADRMFILGWSATGFAIGLVLAASCSLFTYYNFKTFAEHASNRSAQDKYNVGVMLQIVGQDETERAGIISALSRENDALDRRIKASYFIAHACGWLSLFAFLSAAGWLAVNLR
jgi:hypothetical protein